MQMSLDAFALRIKEEVLNISHKAQVGHIGPALSIADIIAALYWDVLKEGDHFILSKGHAVAALYAALHLKGFISKKELYSYCQNGSFFGEHPDHHVSGIELSTGSLGHGLSVGCGMALAGKIDKRKQRVFVLISDAECNEGETWEAALFASHHSLDNLVVVLDDNKVQAFGRTEEILDLEPLASKWESFGWDVMRIDGHKREKLALVLQSENKDNKPRVVIAHTIRGKGVSFMEHKIEWHYLTTNGTQHRRALKEIRNNERCIY